MNRRTTAYDNNRITVSDGCRATFAYGFGNVRPQASSGDSNALPQPPFAALPPATIDANIQMLTADQQRTMQTCLFEAARQTGLTGGTAIRLDSVDFIEQGSGGWRFRFRATGTWPNGQRQYSAFCRATPAQIVEFTVTRPG
ncbi:hypothetical protein [Sandaracinobacteroides hominis]|uniref:hypothetical protein n=1 Tax=Sandaracinobacteroides hominis TaxID=2780086 RepID=UPI0018F67B88|nr:hypothetical protein [Sandaracinobacteroides hominis]